MRIVFVMDPVSKVIVDEDTSFALMLEAEGRGHRVDHCLVQDVYLENGTVAAKVRPATMRRDRERPVTLGDAEDINLADVDVVFVRKDPPFDPEYLWLTLLLEHLRSHRTLIVNDPRGLRDANEKLYATYFADFMPATLATADKVRVKRFVERVGGRAVIKPIEGFGGGGVYVLDSSDLNLNALIETVTRDGQRIAMVQEFIPQVSEGDKRILLLDGEAIGAILRVPQKGDARSNIHVGGVVEAAELDDRDRAIVQAVAPRLKSDGLWFVGIDVIGGRLTEVNVTSPTGIQQASRLMGENLEARVIEWLEHATGAGGE
jgi:glutathione synthase